MHDNPNMTGPLLTQPRPSFDQSHDDDDDPGTRWLSAMHRGNFAAAWDVSDAVLAARDPATRNDPAAPYHKRWVWDGRPLRGQVLVRCYHGLGDTLQFWRYLPALSRQASVTVEVQPELIPLLAGRVRLIPFDPARPTKAACDIEIMELAHALRLAPPPAPYLHAVPLPLPLPRPVIGVCWAAGGWDPGRDAGWPALAALGRAGSVVSLQRGPAAAGATWPDPLTGSMALANMARLLTALDHVVTVDTMVAHLAGALGCPTSILLKHDSDWRWARGRSTSPWYPAARLYRQTTPGDWSVPVARLLADIAAGTESARRAL